MRVRVRVLVLVQVLVRVQQGEHASWHAPHGWGGLMGCAFVRAWCCASGRLWAARPGKVSLPERLPNKW